LEVSGFRQFFSKHTDVYRRAPEEDKPIHRKKVSQGKPRASEASETTSPSEQASPVLDLPVLISQKAGLFFWDSQRFEFVEHGPVTARIQQGASFETWLTASSEDGQLLAHKISSDMNQRWTSKMRSLTWNHLGNDQEMTSWVLRFEGGQEEYEAFLQAFTQALWETLYQTAWGKMKVCYFYFLPLLCAYVGEAR
jgi:hypothetical protein